MKSDFLNDLIEKNDTLNAYIVAKNLFCRNLGDKESLISFLEIGLGLASLDIDIDERKNYLNEVSNSLAVFSENVDMSNDILLLLNSYEQKIKDVFVAISSAEQAFISRERGMHESKNTESLTKLGKLLEELKNCKTQNEFDNCMDEISQIESTIAKDFFTEDQLKTYETLTKLFSSTISKKMEDLNRNSLIDVNKKAIVEFKKAFDSFTKQKDKYSKSESNLKSLLTTTLFAYDSRDLLNESLVYYNHVYSMIFNEVNDDLKFKMTEWSINTDRIKR